MGEFRMPALGAEMTEGRLVEWLVKPGDIVHRGDIVAVVETDKAALEVEVWEEGRVTELHVAEGEKVPVGTLLAALDDLEPAEPVPVAAAAPAVRGPLARHRAEQLGVDLTATRGSAPGGVITRRDVEEAAQAAPPVPAPSAPPAAPPPEARPPAVRPRVSPYARRLARERGADPSGMAGTGPGGAVLARDLPETPAEAASTPRTGTQVGADPMRQAIARAMARSNREIPHYYLATHVDLTAAVAWLEAHNADRPAAERVLPAALQLRAVALALRDHPDLNGYWIDDGFQPAPSIDVGVAIALRGGGLVAPAIHGADGLGVDALMAALHDLVRRVRSGRLRASEVAQATITVTSLGDLGVESVYGVIYPPQVALVGFGRPAQRPWAVGGLLGVRDVVHVTLAGDHRQTDGAVGSRFLAAIDELLQRPEEL